MLKGNELEILLKMTDEATPEFKRFVAQATQETDRLKNRTTQATDSIQQGFKDASKEVRAFRQSMFIATVAMAAVITSVQKAADHNKEAESTFKDFKAATTALSVSLGVALIPVLEKTTKIIDGLSLVTESAMAGFIKYTTFLKELSENSSWNPLKAWDDVKNAINVANQATDEFLAKQEQARSSVTQSLFPILNAESEKERGPSGDNKKIEKQQKEQSAIVAKETRARMALTNAEKNNQIAALDAVSEMASLFGKESKAAFYIQKAVKAAEILVNSAAADMNIQATWAWNPAVASALIAKNKALTMISLATVAAAAIAGSFAKGTSKVPSDMVASIHKGETIIPATFADSIRKGELSLSGPGGSSFGDINIFIQGGINAAGASINEMATQLGFAFVREVRTARGF
jgi:hypothetical protein